MAQVLSTDLSLDQIFISARKEHYSDVHIAPNKPVIFRKFGRLITAAGDPLTQDQIKVLFSQLPSDVFKRFQVSGDQEYVHTITGHGRFRLAMMDQHNGWHLTARVISLEVPEFKSANLPPSCADLTKWAQGMVLITGPAGCGKSTTMSILIEMINQTRHDHIITLEQPIEIIYKPKQCQITQREIGFHTRSQERALRAALREDPDVLVVSELRDLDTARLAITAAETGHLVFGTMNTVNAAQTLSRLIDSFPADEHPVIRNMVSESLRGVISQQLVPKKDGSGVVVAYEVLVVTSSVANIIREGKFNLIANVMATGKSFGMVLMDNSLMALANAGTITAKEACERATNPATMVKMIAA